MIPSYLSKCRLCGNPNLDRFFTFKNQSVQGIFKKEGEKVPLRKLNYSLVRCEPYDYENACGLTQLDLTVPPKILYTQYFYRSSISQTMKDHLLNIAGDCYHLIKKDNPKVLDLASNDGYLLSCYPANYIKFGVDPNNIAAENNDFNICNDFFPSVLFDRFMTKWGYKNDTENYSSVTKYNKEVFDLISCISMLYDLDRPVDFIKEIDKYLKYDGIFVAEVAYFPQILKNNDYSNCCLEHICYYSLHTLEYLLKQANFKIFRIKLSNINGGVIQFWVCREEISTYDNKEWLKEIQELRIGEFDLELDKTEIYSNFAVNINEHSRELLASLTKIKNENKTVHLLGASTKIEVVLNQAGINNNLISYASERTPQKWGMKTIGSNIPIISEEESRRMKPDYYLMGLGWMSKELLQREREFLESGGSFIFLFPGITIINSENYKQYIENK